LTSPVPLLNHTHPPPTTQIFSYLHPGDLLSLSRTGKPYHNLLTSKQNSLSIWRTSRRLLDLPELKQKEKSEATYAELVFGKHCEVSFFLPPVLVPSPLTIQDGQVCNKTVGKPDYYLGTRLCIDCRKDKSVSPPCFLELSLTFSFVASSSSPSPSSSPAPTFTRPFSLLSLLLRVRILSLPPT
jgi:hypothetical protein